MKKLALTTATLLLSTVLYAETGVEETVEIETAVASNWNFNLILEERVSSDKSSQTLIKIQTDTMLTEKISLFGAIWLRDKLPVYHDKGTLTDESEYINYVDLYVGMSYSLHQYFSPYFFFEQYIDRGHIDTEYGNFLATGFSGTLLNEGKHNISYYTEWYTTVNTYELDNWHLWGTESALKYKYSIYDKTQLYLQAVWNTDSNDEGYGVHGYSEGTYSTRLGIQVNF